MRMFDVESSNLAAIGYDPETEVLRVRFKTGGEYEYADVPRETAKSFKTADSVGKFFFSEIKNEFESKKVEVEPEAEDEEATV